MSADFRCHTVGIGAGLQVCYVAQRIGQEGLGGGRGEYRMQVLHKLEARGGEGCQWLSRTTHHNFWSIYEQLQLQTFLNMEKAKAVIQCTIRGNQIFIKTCQGYWLCTRKAERKAKPRLTSTLLIGVALSSLIHPRVVQPKKLLRIDEITHQTAGVDCGSKKRLWIRRSS